MTDASYEGNDHLDELWKTTRIVRGYARKCLTADHV